MKRKKIVKVYPRELLKDKAISVEMIEELRLYSAEKRAQILNKAARGAKAGKTTELALVNLTTESLGNERLR